MPWSTSTRRRRLPPAWPALRAAILRRDRHTCYLCRRPATEVDHITPGDNHHPTNLAAICTPCHKRKTNAESHANRQPRRRPPEPHPGMVTGGG